MSIKIPSIEEMLEAGVHFGHPVSKWHPKAAPYIYGVKNGVHIINLLKTEESLKQVTDIVINTVSKGEDILFVGTKKQAKDLIKKAAIKCEMPYVNERWLGGTFTNFGTVLRSIKKLNKLELEKENGDFSKYTKKEALILTRLIDKLNKNLGGIKNIKKLPALVFVVDLKSEDIAVKEARSKKIPIIAICDTNVDPNLVDYPIPGNDDAVKSIDMIVNVIADAVNDGKKQIKQ
ncbi:MAG TPA: 30S ribosomal protein S2 [bacterium]|nr:30S ribosomal protein S2 [bacterium]